MGAEKPNSGAESVADIKALQTELFETQDYKQKLTALLTVGPPTAEDNTFLAAYKQQHGELPTTLNFAIDGSRGETTNLAIEYHNFLLLRQELDELALAVGIEDKALTEQEKKSIIFREKAIAPTLQMAQKGINKLKPEFMAQLEQSLESLQSEADMTKLTLSEFDAKCTEVRRNLLQSQMASLSGDEFYEHIQKYSFAERRKAIGREKGKPIAPNPNDYLAQYNEIYDEATAKYSVPKGLVLAIHYHESKFDAMAVSDGDCYGVGQLSSYFYAKERKGRPTGYENINPLDAEANIKRSIESLSKLYQRYSDYPEPKRSELTMIAYSSDGPTGARKVLREGLETDAHWYVKKVEANLGELNAKVDGYSLSISA